MVNGVRYHYAEAGHGEPLILIHGFPENWYMWRKLIPELARHYRVIAVDTRGAGWTDAPSGGYGKEAIADEIAAFMDAVGAPRARVMAHDWGAYIAFMLSLRHPEKVRQLVAMDITTPWPNRDILGDLWRFIYQPVLGAPLLGAALLRDPNFIRLILDKASTRHPWTNEDYAMFAAPYRDPAHAAAGSAMYRTFLSHELLPWAIGRFTKTKLQPQTLLMIGADDPVIRPSGIRGFERYSRDLTAEFIPGAGHFLPEEDPEAVLSRALEFFAHAGP
jgi:pimeloyl-ACP methyl ester carboxylesterase